jgi:hypothetical protein
MVATCAASALSNRAASPLATRTSAVASRGWRCACCRLDPRDLELELAPERLQRPRQKRDRVATLEVDVDTGVAALEAGETQREGGEPLGAEHRLERDREIGTGAAGAADVERVLLLGVEVEQPLGGEAPRVELGGASEAGLFVEGKEQLERSVHDLRRLDERQHRCDANAVVGAERGACSVERVAVAPRPDGVDGEVEGDVRVLLAHHVEMRLQGERRRLLAAGRRRNPHDDVAGGIGRGGQIVRRSDGAHVLAHPLFVLRAAGDGEDMVEVAPEHRRFERADEGRGEIVVGGHGDILGPPQSKGTVVWDSRLGQSFGTHDPLSPTCVPARPKRRTVESVPIS